MRYILDRSYKLRGWYKMPYGLVSDRFSDPVFIDKKYYDLLLLCDGSHDFDLDAMDEYEAAFFKELEEHGTIHPAGPVSFLSEDQMYKAYPCKHRSEVQWSLTGACNLKCRHCFMSAPHSKHGNPSYEDLKRIADQIKECGIRSVSLTGGEPLIRSDFLQIVDLLVERGIKLTQIYTNCMLVNEQLLDELEKRSLKPVFQVSFDGVGWHDFLRGVEGAEEKTLEAIRLLNGRGYFVSVSLDLHRKNAGCLRETVNKLASIGVKSLKIGRTIELGEWEKEDLGGLQLSYEDEFRVFCDYIPVYFEDNAPLSIQLSGAFIYNPGEKNWAIPFARNGKPGEENNLACGVLGKCAYIGPDGVVAPCMGMCDTSLADRLPSIKDTELKDILKESAYTELCAATVGDVRSSNEECQKCPHSDRCSAGCRNNSLVAGNGFYGIDPEACFFFKEGWDEKIKCTADQALIKYKGNNK